MAMDQGPHQGKRVDYRCTEGRLSARNSILRRRIQLEGSSFEFDNTGLPDQSAPERGCPRCSTLETKSFFFRVTSIKKYESPALKTMVPEIPKKCAKFRKAIHSARGARNAL
jgi:hypothetical protein